MVVLTFNVGAFTYFNTLKCSYASLHPSKAGSYKQPLRRRVVFSKSIVFDQTYNFLNDNDLLSKKQYKISVLTAKFSRVSMYISFHFIQEQSLLGNTSHLTIFANQPRVSKHLPCLQLNHLM